jgi:predicted ATP-grasp superfamily ATP-dependent carboligase
MPDLVEPSQKLLKALNYTGVCEIEYLLDPRNGQYKLIEINARTWLWVGLAKSCGINYALYVYNYLNKIETQHPSDYLKGIGWVNYITDTPFSLMAIIKHKLTLKQYFSAFRGKRVDAFFSWSDIKPSLMFFVLLFYIAVKRR